MHRSICGLLGKAVHFLEINTSAPQKGTEQLENLCQRYLKGLLSTLTLSILHTHTHTQTHTIKQNLSSTHFLTHDDFYMIYMNIFYSCSVLCHSLSEVFWSNLAASSFTSTQKNLVRLQCEQVCFKIKVF